MSNVKGLTSIASGDLFRKDFNTFAPVGAVAPAHVQAAYEDEGPKTIKGVAPRSYETPAKPQQIKG